MKSNRLKLVVIGILPDMTYSCGTKDKTRFVLRKGKMERILGNRRFELRSVKFWHSVSRNGLNLSDFFELTLDTRIRANH